jgi:hypothetical protein
MKMKRRRWLFLIGVAVWAASWSPVNAAEEPRHLLTVEELEEHWNREVSGTIEQALLSTYPAVYPYGILPKFNLEAVQLISPTRALIRFEGQHDYALVIVEGGRQEGGGRFTAVKIFEPIPKKIRPDTVDPATLQRYRRPPTEGPIHLSQEEWEQIRAQYGDPTFTPKNYTLRSDRFEEVRENVFTMP